MDCFQRPVNLPKCPWTSSPPTWSLLRPDIFASEEAQGSDLQGELGRQPPLATRAPGKLADASEGLKGSEASSRL